VLSDDIVSGDVEWATRARETEALFRTTVENMPGNLLLLDREGRLLYLNPALEAQVVRLCHRTPRELIGMYGGEVWPEFVWGPLSSHLERAVMTRERQTYELEATMASGERTVRQWFVVPVVAADGAVHQILAMNHDITAQRRHLDEAREADRRKSEFIAVLSHELRNPLAAIKTGLFVLDHDATGADAPQIRKSLDRQVGHLVRLVDDLLDITRITKSNIRLQRHRLDLNAAVREVLDDNRTHLERGGVRIEARFASSPVHVDADRTRIAQIVMNLLSNAAKFTPAGGSATISVTVEGSGMAVVTVSDTGVGIEAALLPRLFQPFMQADRTLDRSGGGLGLGLALVKGLVELHGGDVVARSAGVNRGTELVVRLPLSVSAQMEAVVPDGAAPTSRRVLLIEDDHDIAEGLRFALELDTHEVVLAYDGRDGLAKARTFRPDVVLCDIGLPRMNGYDVARAFRADRELDTNYLVALTGYAQPEDLEMASAAGFDQHLAKPTDMTLLRRIIATAPRPGTRRMR
jgi:PAS domain S-box-containing protein